MKTVAEVVGTGQPSQPLFSRLSLTGRSGGTMFIGCGGLILLQRRTNRLFYDAESVLYGIFFSHKPIMARNWRSGDNFSPCPNSN
jgi:hypothetical protein